MTLCDKCEDKKAMTLKVTIAVSCQEVFNGSSFAWRGDICRPCLDELKAACKEIGGKVTDGAA